jgi:hypothetical protein
MQKVDLLRLPVEVSGWDAAGRFFVEYSTLDSTGLGQKTLLLRHAVQTCSLIFIRAVHADSFARSHPQAHHVESMEPSERFGYSKLHLRDFPPRRNGGCEPNTPPEHPIGVREEVKP